MMLLLIMAGLTAFGAGWTVLAFLEPVNGKGFATIFWLLSKDDVIPVQVPPLVIPYQVRVARGFESLTGLPLLPTAIVVLLVSLGVIALVARHRARAHGDEPAVARAMGRASAEA